MEILRASNLVKIYGNNDNKVYAVKNVDLVINKGEFVAITGKSGSGKSTLLHLLGGVDIPTSGSVCIDGVNIYEMKDDKLTSFRRSNIGFIYQFYNLIPVLDVRENIILPVSLEGIMVDEEYFDEVIKTLDLGKRLNHLPNELSGGQQQRVAIGRAIINHPKIILADEPTGNLDSKNSKKIINMLKYYNRQYGQTIVMVTHDSKIANMADRVITINDGKIVGDEMSADN
ncbi:MAG: ABC transporter ATP-binding protein [Bacilli bacterium]|nr:ABC transporter ATP-binding protein [Bacilli bacterium]